MSIATLDTEGITIYLKNKTIIYFSTNDGREGEINLKSFKKSRKNLPESILIYGDTGEAVKQLQVDLRSIGYRLALSEEFDNDTLEAVIRFQIKHRCNIDGMVGRQTYTAIKYEKYHTMVEPTLSDKLKEISGKLKDVEVPMPDESIISLTRDEYSNLPYIDPNKFYRITDDYPSTEQQMRSITSNRIPYEGNSTWNYSTTTDIHDQNISVQSSFEEMKKELEKMKENMTRQLNVTMLHGCRNCGAKIEVDINKPVFCCKYCGTSYVIGTVHQNSTY